MHDASASHYLNNPRLAAYAIAPEPVWLWRADGSRALWANAAGAALFDATTVGKLTARHFESAEPEAQQVIRLAQSLADDGAPRLERLRVFGAGLLLHPLICACSRLAVDDDTPAILICGIEPMRPALSLNERVHRLFDGSVEKLAAFTLAGDLVFATEAAREQLGSANNLGAIEATALATDAISAGQAAGSIPSGPVTLWRVGRQSDTILIARFEKSQPHRLPPLPVEEATDVEQIEAPADTAKPSYPESVSQAIALSKSSATTPVRRHPLRFVWELDADQHFTLTSQEFISLAGPATAQKNGALWGEICAALGIDPYQQVANAIATHDTWSGIVLSWPTATADNIKVELSGLPIFDRQRRFTGYRGFGVCRDLAQLDRLSHATRSEPPLLRAADETADKAPAITPEPFRPALSIVPPGANIVRFPAALPTVEQRTPSLSAGERKAFSDIAQQLSARLRSTARLETTEQNADRPPETITSQPPALTQRGLGIDGRAPATSAGNTPDGEHGVWFAEESGARVLLENVPFGVLIYRPSEMLFANQAFLDRLGFADLTEFSDNGGLDSLQLASTTASAKSDGQSFTIAPTKAGQSPIEARLISLPPRAEKISALILTGMEPRRQPEIAAGQRASIRENGPDRALDKIHEQQLDELRRQLEQAATGHTEFLKRINRDLRTPLTAIMGFAETILGERFGPIGNERYRDYLSGIRNAGARILALVDELEHEPDTDEVKTENKSAPTRDDVDLNRIVQTCVGELQPGASRDRVLIRTSLHRPLPDITADGNAVRQIVLNLLTNSIRLAGAGGQVIISTGVSGAGTVSLRLRDTGTGVNETDVEAALKTEPAQDGRSDASEGRLKLAVAKALVEANRASLKISSKPDEGTLVEVSFREVSSPAA
ncbi:MAG: sensor histidine kinase [Xanthobacteraceae bacterium]